ncbi:aquaporin [Ligilactobacillus sp. WILCCON 0076]|uniref:Aquaporin n=1 Tax=Ligilactobacillus ubinensis TaxID=2876789 RepID=A0A9X2JLN3_9LACO|nr:aquaporin [Ligilactobacillus ubinensis]MCP0887084.1 aquaporin [Ligilactobacillus ubinensis]
MEKQLRKIDFILLFRGGVAVTMAIYVAGSLGYLNLAITVSYALFGLFVWEKVLSYLTGQVLDAFLGTVIVMIYFYPQFKKTTSVESRNSVSIFATMPAIENKIFNF